jgi:GT2 family glycosyltransferase
MIKLTDEDSKIKQLEQSQKFIHKKLDKNIHQKIKYQQELDKIEKSLLYKVFKIIEGPFNYLIKIAKKIVAFGLTITKKTILKSGFLVPIAEKSIRILKPYLKFHNGSIVKKIMATTLAKKRDQQYQVWLKKHYPTKEILKKQQKESAKLKYKPLISVIVPTYNTPPLLLKEMIESVLAQSYQNWELCIADDASPDEQVRETIKSYASKAKRIRYVFRKQNGHISVASNSAIEISKGEYIALLDHDDILWPNALYEVVKALNKNKTIDFVYTDEDKLTADGKRMEDPLLKPDWSPDFLRSCNIITHFAVIRKSLVDKVGGFRKGFEGTQDWDLFLRVTRRTNKVHHIPTVLYDWRKTKNSTAMTTDAKDYAYTNQRKALEDDVISRGFNKSSVHLTQYLGFWNVTYDLEELPLVSIIIPTKDKIELIKKCLDSIYKLTTYPNYEIILADTGSKNVEVWKLYKNHQDKQNLQILKWNKSFNYSGVNNYAVSKANGNYLLFLNNDTEVIAPRWIESMLAHAQRSEVGAVGAKLLYANNAIQHAGVVLGMGGMEGAPPVAGNIFGGWDNAVFDPHKVLWTDCVRNVSAVTAACMLVSKAKFNEAGGFDESFKIAFNDVDFCLKLRQNGYWNVYTPYALLYHHESVSMGRPGENRRDLELFKQEHVKMNERWGGEFLNNDPFFNPNYDIKKAFAEITT